MSKRARILAFLALLPFVVSAQGFWMRPASEVHANTNGWTYIPTTMSNVQAVINWLDENVGFLDAGSVYLDTNGWTNVNPADTNVQAAFEWLDSNWVHSASEILVETNGWLVLNPSSTNVQSTLDFLDGWLSSNWNAAGVSVATSGWTRLNGDGATNVQETLNYLDHTLLPDIYSNLNTEAQAGAARGFFNGGYTSTVGTVSWLGKDITPLAVTGIVHGGTTAQANTNVLAWGTEAGSDTNRLYIRKNGGYYIAVLANVGWGDPLGVSPAGMVVYGVISDSNNVTRLTFPVSSSSAPSGTGVTNYTLSSGSVVYYDGTVGDRFGVYAYSGGTTGTFNLGAVYVDAFKLYNRD